MRLYCGYCVWAKAKVEKKGTLKAGDVVEASGGTCGQDMWLGLEAAHRYLSFPPRACCIAALKEP